MTSSPHSSTDTLAVPHAPRENSVRQIHADTLVDPYEWLRQADSPRTKEFISQENSYCQRRLQPLKPLQDRLYKEFTSRILQTDMSVPTRMHGYWYFARTRQGQQYAIQCRIPVRDEADWTAPQVDLAAEPASLPEEEVFFDSNVEAKGSDFFRLGGLDLSSDGRFLLYCVDTAGDERYQARIRDLSTGQDLPDCLEDISSGPVLTPDGQWVFYAKVDQAWRPCSIWRHRVGSEQDRDVCVYEESDQHYWLGVSLSFDESKVLISSSSKTTSEVLLMDVSNPCGEFTSFAPRQDGIEYDVSFASFAAAGPQGQDVPLAIVFHNVGKPNFAVNVINMASHQPPYQLTEGTCVAQGSPYGCEQASQNDRLTNLAEPYMNPANPAILQGAKGLSIEGLGIYQHFAVLAYRSNGLPALAVISAQDAAEDFLQGRPWRFQELTAPASQGLYSIAMADNPSYEAPKLRYSFGSYTRPEQLRELDPASGQDQLLKQAQVLGEYDPDQYCERRVWVRARDSTLIPVCLVWRRDCLPHMEALVSKGSKELELPSPDLSTVQWPDGSQERAGAPTFITGYGAYEISSDPGFSVGRLSLLDRGVLYAVVQVRGGGEMGRAWYEQGRRLKKLNTFYDFVDASAALQAAGWSDPRRTVANGGSAGGLLMGAVANMAPQLYAGIEADVPFVDALTSILDPDLPLTVTEWDEWGDPLHDPDVYAYMKAYSPYDNVPTAAQRLAQFGSEHFPRIFATTSLNDTRVLYVEPLKWIARLQEPQVGADAMVKIEVEAGHSGASGRYRQWEELALENAFCLAILTPEDPDVRNMEWQ